MIDIRELRIGNWFMGGWKGDAHLQVTPAHLAAWGGMMGSFPEPQPIPLTEEWLKKFGFNQEKYPNYPQYFMIWVDVYKIIYRRHVKWKADLHELVLEGNGMYDEVGELDLTDKCKYVHQLQNLYFALTGTELTLTDSQI